MDSTAAWGFGHRPELDGLRGLAVLAVLVGHSNPEWFPTLHGIGLQVFFVMSGYLITALLLEEWSRDGRVRLRAFYRRRAVRLLPALAVLLAVVAPVAWLLGSTETLMGAGAGATYSSNFVWVAGHDLGGLAHLWSLAIEEHFYLLWPIVLLAVRPFGVRAVTLVAVTLAVASFGWQNMLIDAGAGDAAWMRTDARAWALLVGCAAAGLTALGVQVPRAATMVGLALVGVAGFATHLDSFTEALPLAAAGTALVCLASDRRFGPLRWAPLTFTGERSYGLYLWHYPLYFMVGGGAIVAWGPVPGLALIAGAYALAGLSWRFVEQPAQRRWRSAIPAQVGELNGDSSSVVTCGDDRDLGPVGFGPGLVDDQGDLGLTGRDGDVHHRGGAVGRSGAGLAEQPYHGVDRGVAFFASTMIQPPR